MNREQEDRVISLTLGLPSPSRPGGSGAEAPPSVEEARLNRDWEMIRKVLSDKVLIEEHLRMTRTRLHRRRVALAASILIPLAGTAAYAAFMTRGDAARPTDLSMTRGDAARLGASHQAVEHDTPIDQAKAPSLVAVPQTPEPEASPGLPAMPTQQPDKDHRDGKPDDLELRLRAALGKSEDLELRLRDALKKVEQAEEVNRASRGTIALLRRNDSEKSEAAGRKFAQTIRLRTDRAELEARRQNLVAQAFRIVESCDVNAMGIEVYNACTDRNLAAKADAVAAQLGALELISRWRKLGWNIGYLGQNRDGAQGEYSLPLPSLRDALREAELNERDRRVNIARGRVMTAIHDFGVVKEKIEEINQRLREIDRQLSEIE